MASRSGAEGVKVSKYSISCLRMIEKFVSIKILGWIVIGFKVVLGLKINL